MVYHCFFFLSTFRKNSFHLIDAEFFLKNFNEDSCLTAVHHLCFQACMKTSGYLRIEALY